MANEFCYTKLVGGGRRGLAMGGTSTRVKARLFGALTVVVGAVSGGGALLALPLSAIGPVQAGADTASFSTTCTGTPIGTVVFPTAVTGSIPAEMSDGTSFGVLGNQWLVTMPATVTADINSFYGANAFGFSPLY